MKKMFLLTIAICFFSLQIISASDLSSGKEKDKQGFVISISGLDSNYAIEMLLYPGLHGFALNSRMPIQDYSNIFTNERAGNVKPIRIPRKFEQSVQIFRDDQLLKGTWLIIHAAKKNGIKYSDIEPTQIGIGMPFIYVEPGDSVNIEVDSEHIKFSGPSAAKFEICYELSVIERSQWEMFSQLTNRNLKISLLYADSLKYYYTKKDEQTFRLLGLVASNRKISSKDSSFLCGKIIVENIGYKVGYFYNLNWVSHNPYKSLQDSLRLIYNDPLSFESSILNSAYHNPTISRTSFFLSAIQGKYEVDSCRNRGIKNRFEPVNFYKFSTKRFSGDALESLLYNCIRTWKNDFGGEVEQVIDLALRNKQIHTPIVKKYFEYSKNEVSVLPGQTAFDFNLLNYNGKSTSLKDFKGKVVLMDSWYVHCTPCIVMYETIIDSLTKELEHNPNFQFLSVCTALGDHVDISTDLIKNVVTWKENVDKEIYTSPRHSNLLADPASENGKRFIRKYQITGGPTLTLIDKHGKIVAVPYPPSKNGLKAAIEKLL